MEDRQTAQIKERYRVEMPTTNVLGCDVHISTMAAAVEHMHQAVKADQQLRIGVVNAAKLVNMQKDSRLGEDVNSSDLILADGASVVWAAKLLGRPLPERVAGIDLMFEGMQLADQHGLRVFCLGASQEVLDKVVAEFGRRYPNAVIAGACDGYFTEEDEPKVADQIAAAQADLLFVAITSPKKENFMARWGDHIRVGVIHGVGGSFDIVAGKTKRAPEIWQRLGMEWLYRVLQEPRRLFARYFQTNVAFIWRLLKQKFAQ